MKPCIFCGTPSDSKEDLFPRWILKRVVTRQPLYRKMGNMQHVSVSPAKNPKFPLPAPTLRANVWCPNSFDRSSPLCQPTKTSN
jgi:hypothetical protein